VEKGICNDEKHIDGWPPGTLSVGNYYKYISSSMIAGPATTVWVLNLMLLDGADLFGQVDTLIASIPNTNDIQFIELGNEYYLKDYVNVFPNASSYMEKAVPVAQYIQSKLPNAKVSFVCEYEASWTPHAAQWNQAVVSNALKFPVEYVTVHDYSMGFHTSGNVPAANLTEVALWGESSVPHIVTSIEKAYAAGSNATQPPKVFISEFGLAPQFDKTLGVSALKAIFTFNYQMAGFCNTSGQSKAHGVELTFLHVLWGGISWTENWVTALLGDTANTAPSYSTASQALAHIARVGVQRFDGAECLAFDSITSSGEGCGSAVTVGSRSGIQCLRGLLFRKESSSSGAFTLVVSNGCDEGITATFVVPRVSSESRNGTHTVYHAWYHFKGETGFVPFPENCGGELWAPACDRSQWGNWDVPPQSAVHLKASAKAIELEFPPVTLSIVEFPL
jgi:hypothetical protein